MLPQGAQAPLFTIQSPQSSCEKEKGSIYPSVDGYHGGCQEGSLRNYRRGGSWAGPDSALRTNQLPVLLNPHVLTLVQAPTINISGSSAKKMLHVKGNAMKLL